MLAERLPLAGPNAFDPEKHRTIFVAVIIERARCAAIAWFNKALAYEPLKRTSLVALALANDEV